MHQHRWAWKPVVEFIIMTASKIEMGYLLGVSHIGNTHRAAFPRLAVALLLLLLFSLFWQIAQAANLQLQPISNPPLPSAWCLLFPSSRTDNLWGETLSSTCRFHTGSRSEPILQSSKPNSPKWLRQEHKTKGTVTCWFTRREGGRKEEMKGRWTDRRKEGRKESRGEGRREGGRVVGKKGGREGGKKPENKCFVYRCIRILQVASSL